MKKKKFINLIIIFISCLLVNVKAVSNTDLETFKNNLTNTKNTINSQLFLSSHPVGSIYITTNTDENTTSKMASLHGGTWEVYAQDKKLVGAGNGYNINTTGGSYNKSFSIGVNNLPSHSHTFVATGSVTSNFYGGGAYTSSNGEHTHNMSLQATRDESSGFGLIYGGGGFINRILVLGGTKSIEAAGEHTHTVTASGSVTSTFYGSQVNTSSVGGGQAVSFDATNPYIAVYMYKRVT